MKLNLPILAGSFLLLAQITASAQTPTPVVAFWRFENQAAPYAPDI